MGSGGKNRITGHEVLVTLHAPRKSGHLRAKADDAKRQARRYADVLQIAVLRGSSSRDETQLNSTVAYSTNGVELYPTASNGAGDTFDTRQRSDHPALNSIQTFPEHRGSSKEFYRQVSKLRRTHHHGFNINKSLAQHRKNGSVIFSTSDSSGSSIRTLQKFPRKNQVEAMAQRIMRPQTLQKTLKSTILPIPIAAARPVAISRCQTRHSSHSPLGAPPAAPRKKVTINTLQALYNKDEPITMMTAHDFPSAHVADHAGMDMILVGDSLAMVALGMQDTSEVMLEEMILHCRSVARATKAAFTVRFP